MVRPRKTLLQNLYQKLAETAQPYHHIHFNLPVRSDLMWWALFIQSWNGMSMLLKYRPQRSDHEIWTDASGSFGCGALWGRRWLKVTRSEIYREAPHELGEDGITL